MGRERDLANSMHTASVGQIVPQGATGSRPGTPQIGYMRFNSTLDSMEQYTVLGWRTMDAGRPIIESISPTTFNGLAGTTITVTGHDFEATTTLRCVGQDGTVYTPGSSSFVSSQSMTFATPALTVANEPYTIRATNPNGLMFNFDDALDAGGVPTWTTAAGSLGSISESATGTHFTLAATDPEGGAVTYAVTTGALPSGLSLNASTGAISGDPVDVGTDTTTNFSVTASDPAANGNERAFSITVNDNQAPVWSTAAGSIGSIYDLSRSTFSVTVVATDPDADTITYSVVSGALPTGMSLASATGVINGTANAETVDTTYTFTIRASDGSLNTDRVFTLTVKAPVVSTYSATGSVQTFTVPAGVTTVKGEVWGSGGGTSGGGCGYANGTFTVAPTDVLNITVAGAVSGGTGAVGGGSSMSGGNGSQGGGGGTGIWTGAVNNTAYIALVGGGGGGGAPGECSRSGGGGGGTNGGAGGGGCWNSSGGGGGTQNGGAAQWTGGNGSGSGPKGGGGGGWWGGSGGAGGSGGNHSSGGGGGSGYVNTAITGMSGSTGANPGGNPAGTCGSGDAGYATISY